MSDLIETAPLHDLSGLIAEVRGALSADELIPYLGPGLLALSGSALPSAPEEVAAQLNKRAPAPSRIRTNMWSVAQFIEGRRHRKTLQAFMADIFAAPSPASPLLMALAEFDLALVVNSWYDDGFATALKAVGRGDFVEIQGVTRAGFSNDWTRAYDRHGVEIDPATAGDARNIVYSPHGGVRPAKNFLVSDSDYVEAMTEIDIQSPIPDAVKARRTTRGFLFMGCRFDDQMLRTYARQIMKRSKGPHYAVIDTATATRNELRFLEEREITPINAPLAAVQAALG